MWFDKTEFKTTKNTPGTPTISSKLCRASKSIFVCLLVLLHLSIPHWTTQTFCKALVKMNGKALHRLICFPVVDTVLRSQRMMCAARCESAQASEQEAWWATLLRRSERAGSSTWCCPLLGSFHRNRWNANFEQLWYLAYLIIGQCVK